MKTRKEYLASLKTMSLYDLACQEADVSEACTEAMATDSLGNVIRELMWRLKQVRIELDERIG